MKCAPHLGKVGNEAWPANLADRNHRGGYLRFAEGWSLATGTRESGKVR
jgi:hypothetical protein